MTIAGGELFELCKQVYEVTGWESPQMFAAAYDAVAKAGYYSRQSVGEPLPPLYTSDYLLEKLPKQYRDYWLVLQPFHFTEGTIRWRAFYQEDESLAVGEYKTADTPLKALLKLTLELHRNKML